MTDDEKEKLRSIQALVEAMNTRCFQAALTDKFSNDSRQRMKARCQWIIDNL